MKRVGIVIVLSLIAALPAGPVSAAGGTFSDDDTSIHESNIEALAAAGITKGCAPSEYCPDDPVTRGQMAAFLVRALGLSPATGTPFIDDDDSTFEADIQTLSANGITKGCATDRFCPDDPVTRGQMASFLVRAMQLSPLVPVSFVASDRAPINPERGFYQSVDLLGEDDLSWVRDMGVTLVHAYVRLDDYRARDIPTDVLADVSEHLAVARAAGVKVVFRASYNFGIGEPDASLSWVLRHIEQLQPVWTANSDVIAVVQAGFIGAWGEWHSSTNGLDTPENRETILSALLDAVPDDRMVQLRYPGDLIEAYGAPLGASAAHDGSGQARTGHHNDCFLSGPDDVGTYNPNDRAEEFKTFLAAQTTWTWTGGETCDAELGMERWTCDVALEEMERFHFSYLNMSYYEGALDDWRSGGCYNEIFDRLGYRIRATGAALGADVRPGGELQVSLTLANEGFAAPMNPRQAFIVLTGPERIEIPIDADPRDWQPGPISLSLSVPVPGDAAAGRYDVSLWLPDPDLPSRADYAIRLANEDIWQAGRNLIGTVTVRS